MIRNGFISKIFVLFSWTEIIFFTRGWRASLLVNMWSVTAYTWTPKYVFLNFYFLILWFQISFSWTQKLMFLKSSLTFWRPLHLYSSTLELRIPDLCQLVFWLVMPGFPKTNQYCKMSVANIISWFFLFNEVKAHFPHSFAFMFTWFLFIYMMFACHKNENWTSSQLKAFYCNHVFDDGVLIMYMVHDALHCYLQFYTDSFFTLQ